MTTGPRSGHHPKYCCGDDEKASSGDECLKDNHFFDTSINLKAIIDYSYASRGRLDGSARDLDNITTVNKILSLAIVATHFSFKLISARRSPKKLSIRVCHPGTYQEVHPCEFCNQLCFTFHLCKIVHSRHNNGRGRFGGP